MKKAVIVMSILVCSSTMYSMDMLKKKKKDKAVPTLDLKGTTSSGSKSPKNPLASSSPSSGSGTPKTPVNSKGDLKAHLSRRKTSDKSSHDSSSKK
jgi:hypothetical protein